MYILYTYSLDIGYNRASSWHIVWRGIKCDQRRWWWWWWSDSRYWTISDLFSLFTLWLQANVVVVIVANWLCFSIANSLSNSPTTTRIDRTTMGQLCSCLTTTRNALAVQWSGVWRVGKKQRCQLCMYVCKLKAIAIKTSCRFIGRIAWQWLSIKAQK